MNESVWLLESHEAGTDTWVPLRVGKTAAGVMQYVESLYDSSEFVWEWLPGLEVWEAMSNGFTLQILKFELHA